LEKSRSYSTLEGSILVKKIRGAIVPSICLILAVTGCVFGQADANKGQITGTIFDPKQAAIPNAKITITNITTNAVREITSGPAGEYRAVLLEPGQYDVRVEAPGFAPTELKGVTVNVGSAIELPVTLAVGTTVTTIEVTAEAEAVVLPSPTSIINTEAIENLPINGRRFTDFAALTPTVQIDPQRGSISFAAQRGINGNVMMDGTDYNNPFFGGMRGGERSGYIPTVPQSAIQEFQVVTTGYGPEYGRSTGGIVNAVSKSGANEYHGEAFYQIRPRPTAEENPFIPTIRATPGITVGETREQLQQYGGGMGGAFIKDKLFWYAAAERQATDVPRQVFFQSIAGITPTPSTQEAISFYQSQAGPLTSTNNGSVVSGRLDYQMANGSRLTARFNYNDASAANAITTGAPLLIVDNRALSGSGTELDRTYTGIAQYTRILNANMVNDLRFSGTYELRPRTSNSAIPNVSNAIGNFGARNFLPTTEDDSRYQVVDGLTVLHGEHAMKFGGDYSYLHTYQEFGFNQFGSITFGTSDIPTLLKVMSVAPGQNRFDDTTVRYALQIGNRLADYNMHQIALYAQDAWKITPQFQINYGVRWEGQVNPQAVATNTAVVQAMQSTSFPLNGKFDPSTLHNNMNQWMPRFGFTYSPFKGSTKTVLRGHAGLFYAATPMVTFTGTNNNFRLPPGDLSISYIPAANGPTVYQVFKQAGVDLNTATLGNLPILTPTQLTNSLAALTGSAPNPFLQASFTGTANDYQNPRAFQAGFGGDQNFGHGWVASAQLNYVNTVHLERNRDYNLPQPTLRAADGRWVFNRNNRPLPQYGQLTIRESSARSMYRGLTLSVRNTSLKHVQFGAEYTAAQAYSDDDNERSAGGFVYDNPANFKPEYGYANLDVRNSFSAYAVSHLPWGFIISGDFSAASGQPIDPIASADINGDGSTSDRAYQAIGVPFTRNSFRNRGWKSLNLRFIKEFRVHEKYRFQLSAELFNAFNWDNVIIGSSANSGANNANTIYGPGINANGTVAAARTDANGPTFMRLKLPNGLYDANNGQVGLPFQAQFGARFFF
jgi:hypothetical protein